MPYIIRHISLNSDSVTVGISLGVLAIISVATHSAVDELVASLTVFTARCYAERSIANVAVKIQQSLDNCISRK